MKKIILAAVMTIAATGLLVSFNANAQTATKNPPPVGAIYVPETCNASTPLFGISLENGAKLVGATAPTCTDPVSYDGRSGPVWCMVCKTTLSINDKNGKPRWDSPKQVKTDVCGDSKYFKTAKEFKEQYDSCFALKKLTTKISADIDPLQVYSTTDGSTSTVTDVSTSTTDSGGTTILTSPIVTTTP